MNATPARSLVVVTAGLSQPSATRLLADRLSAAVDRHLRDAGAEPTVEVIELRDHAQDLTNNLLTGFPSPKLQSALDAVLSADGLIAVTPIFSASYSGLFKMFFDIIDRDGLLKYALYGVSPRGHAAEVLKIADATAVEDDLFHRDVRAVRRLARLGRGRFGGLREQGRDEEDEDDQHHDELGHDASLGLMEGR